MLGWRIPQKKPQHPCHGSYRGAVNLPRGNRSKGRRPRSESRHGRSESGHDRIQSPPPSESTPPVFAMAECDVVSGVCSVVRGDRDVVRGESRVDRPDSQIRPDGRFRRLPAAIAGGFLGCNLTTKGAFRRDMPPDAGKRSTRRGRQCVRRGQCGSEHPSATKPVESTWWPGASLEQLAESIAWGRDLCWNCVALREPCRPDPAVPLFVRRPVPLQF